VAERFPEELNIFALSVNTDIAALKSQAEKYKPSIICASGVAGGITSDIETVYGQEGLEYIASHPDVDIVVNAVSGFAGLRSTIAAAHAGKRIALANKESMVTGGELLNSLSQKHGFEIIPVDSEHSAIFQCLKSGSKPEVRNLILTSSGGPFRNLPPAKFAGITVEQALAHPTWNMGKKITVDSATLMNKGLELIEAVYMFGVKPDQIEIVIHPQSIVHSMVEFVDGSVIAQMSKPDMRLPIQYALFYPERRDLDIADLPFDNPVSLQFESPDQDKFPSLRMARQALAAGGTAPAAFNAADEVAVAAFLEKRIKFVDIFAVVDHVLNKFANLPADNIESIVEADKNSRAIASEFIAAKGN